METEHYSDDQLTAYLDGELEARISDEIRLAANNSPDLAQRIRALEIDRDQLEQGMGQLLSIAPQMPDLPVDLKAETEEQASALAANLRSIAAGLVLLVIGGIGGYLANQEPEAGWKDYVAAYHLLYVNSTLANIDTNPEIQVTELTRVSEAIAKPLDAAKIKEVAGLDYKRAQILGFEGKPIAQLTFLSKMGEPIALCILRSDNAGAKIPTAQNLEGMASASWSDKGYAYLLIGGKDQTMISEAAEKFAKLL